MRMKPSFRNDYSTLAHKRILEALAKYAGETNVAYGLDYHSENAAKSLKRVFGCPKADVHFLAGGTQTNLAFISYALRPYEAVISLESGHINVHETGAVEGSGHKIVLVKGKDGKMYPEDVEKACALHGDEHMVKPRMVYISDSTETGTIYSRKELLDLREICDRLGLIFFIDGARLGSALTSNVSDVEPELIGKVADAFYVGGTKNGLMLGEALIIVNPELHEGFRHHIKNRGAMLAKGYGIGIQFEEAFRDGLYFELAKKANVMADLLKVGFKKLGLPIEESPTNQVFVTLPREKALALIDAFGCEKWADLGETMIIRFVTSYATTEEDVEEALRFIKAM